MAQLLQVCYREQRAPRNDELYIQVNTKKCRITYTAERIDTGGFDRLDDDTLAEVLFRLPMQSRIVFVKGLCKQFAGVAHEHNVFKALYVSPSGYTRYDTSSEEVNNRLGTVSNWSFLCVAQIEELKLSDSGRTTDVPPKSNLQCLVKLSLHRLVAPVMWHVLKSIDPSKLKDLSLMCVKGGNGKIALLTNSNRLERLTLDSLPHFAMSKIIDAWRKASNGFPPLRFLSIICLGVTVTMQDVDRLDLDELHCEYISGSIGKAYLPSMRTLCVAFGHHEVGKEILLLKKLVESCPGLETLNLKIRFPFPSDACACAAGADEMKKEFPKLNVITFPHT